MKIATLALSVALAGACAHTENQTPAASSSSQTATTTSKESKTTLAIRKRAAFDLNCDEAQIHVSQLQQGTFLQAASYGAVCGDKRISYLERMGTIIKQ